MHLFGNKSSDTNKLFLKLTKGITIKNSHYNILVERVIAGSIAHKNGNELIFQLESQS